jgi:predicted NUDIX family NTP pyrophosphohydrolase
LINYLRVKMSAKRSAGILFYRARGGVTEVLLGHPGGPYYDRKPDLGVWSIPKGEPEASEIDLEAVARREFTEETSFAVHGPLLNLGSIIQKGGKEVFAWAARGELDPAVAKSNLFSLEWPPGSGRISYFPEVDKVAWFGPAEARIKLRAAQIPFLERLEAALKSPKPQGAES